MTVLSYPLRSLYFVWCSRLCAPIILTMIQRLTVLSYTSGPDKAPDSCAPTHKAISFFSCIWLDIPFNPEFRILPSGFVLVSAFTPFRVSTSFFVGPSVSCCPGDACCLRFDPCPFCLVLLSAGVSDDNIVRNT